MELLLKLKTNTIKAALLIPPEYKSNFSEIMLIHLKRARTIVYV